MSANRKWFFIGLGVIGALAILKFAQGPSVHLRIHDQLDSTFVNYAVAARHDLTKGASPVAEIMNGAVRVANLASPFSAVSWLFAALPALQAYLVNDFLVRLLAFLGVFLLTARIAGLSPPMRTAIAICWALVPFYTIYGLSVAGQPLLLNSLLALRERKPGVLDWLVVVLFPYYSSFILAGFFISLAATAWFLVELAISRKWNPGWFAGICLLTLPVIFIEWQPIRTHLLRTAEVSHRVEFAARSISVLDGLKRALKLFLFGHYHAGRHTTALLLAGLVLLVLSAFRARAASSRRLLLPSLVLALLAAASLFAGLYSSSLTSELKSAIPLLRLFQFDRLYMLLPAAVLCFFALAASSVMSSGRHRLSTAILASALALQAGIFAWSNEELAAPLQRRLGKTSGFSGAPLLCFDEYFSPELFSFAGNAIPLPKAEYRIICIGFPPAIAQYNGFYTLDGYQPDYPLSYKKEFRRIIARELAKSRRWSDYFDGWGSKCYTFLAELPGTYYTKTNEVAVHQVELDLHQFSRLGGRYILSAVDLRPQEGLVLVEDLGSPVSPWRLRIYGLSRLFAGE